MSDPFAQVAALPGVTVAVADARGAVDRLLGHRILRRRSAEVSAESALRGACASAALDGVPVPLDDLRNAAISHGAAGARDGGGPRDDGGPRDGGGSQRGKDTADRDRAYVAGDPVVQGALRVSAEIGALAETWRHAPRQALARLHVLAAADAVPPAELGRPRRDGQDVRDPLDLGPPPAPAEVAARLDGLVELLARPTKAPAIVVGALVHGELLALRPFGWGDGLVARAAQRLTLVDRGLDPKSLTAPEVGHADRTAEYADALRGYISGQPGAVARWIEHCAQAVTVAARDSLAICEALLRG